jgi:hypothetical protein
VGGVPSALSIFTYRPDGVTVTEAGALALPGGTAFQLYAELSGTIRSGLAVANPSPDPVTVTISSSGVSSRLLLPPNGQTSLFLNEIPAFASLAPSFQGIVRVTAPVLFW